MQKLPKKLKLNVLPSDIKYGMPDHVDLCPIARAVKRRFRGRGYDVRVTDTVIGLYRKGDNNWFGCPIAEWPLPEEATEFVHAFDEGAAVDPFSFVTDERENYASA